MDMHKPSAGPISRGIAINGENVDLDDPKVLVREILNAAGLTPASEFQTILVERGRTHLLGTEDDFVVADHPHGQLRAFRSDRSYGFTVNEIGQVWGTEQIDTDEFSSIWPAPAGCDWVLEREDQPDVIIRPASAVSFGPTGVEHIVSRPHHAGAKLLVTIQTLSGIFPAEGALRVEGSELISDVLVRAAKKLQIVDTTGYVLTDERDEKREIAASLTFAQAGLSGTVVLNWMPREGGGGNA
ncbi:hypothetical protein MKK88_12095 [Methylobacterium sp. E-005]|uniref:hypothetical protein n=1 Tax=Methylobacterium sp. E-005 TaxID=2836549 RepID=UPI001FB945B1|nr:hypothetical protein [Methylobacterium sp. E-005]MCJ2086728.1 hypothetical protein [Methylobacterium sp. E-005]